MKPILVQRGFSLVETVIAIGIMALAVTALLGLLPHGIEMTRQAGNESAYARILNTVRTEVGRVDFASMSALENQRLIFDEQGIRLPKGASGSAAQLVAYVAEVDFNGPRNVAVVLTSGAAAEPALHNFVVRIAATPLPDFNFQSTLVSGYRSYPLLMAKNF
jgi:uncharacterized protein (TIGR02598 family)